jgi:hypothetical protein
VDRKYINLIQLFEGYVRNYRRMNLTREHNSSMFTKREIDYFANLGEMLGFETFIEDGKFDKEKGKSRPMDLSWWKWDKRIDPENYVYLALHLERENQCNRDLETIDKLFSKTEENYAPHNVIGIQFIDTKERIEFLNEVVIEKNVVQRSNVLMIYRYYDKEFDLERIYAYSYSTEGLKDIRKAVCKQDFLGHWYMCFEEEFEDTLVQ